MEIIVNIDVSKDRLDVHVFAIRGGILGEQRPRRGRGPGSAARSSVAVRCRIGGDRGFERLAVAALAGAGLAVVVVNPAQVRAYISCGTKRHGKRLDSQDSRSFLSNRHPLLSMQPLMSRSMSNSASMRFTSPAISFNLEVDIQPARLQTAKAGNVDPTARQRIGAVFTGACLHLPS